MSRETAIMYRLRCDKCGSTEPSEDGEFQWIDLTWLQELIASNHWHCDIACMEGGDQVDLCDWCLPCSCPECGEDLPGEQPDSTTYGWCPTATGEGIYTTCPNGHRVEIELTYRNKTNGEYRD